ncbi:MAG: hypothetical protein M3M89_00375 [Thermoproteota archaeon]|nr:hypothetical protein [Thermoproteota archaeon]
MKTATTTAATMTTTTTTDNKSIGSQYLAKYVRNVQQASEATAAQYEYRGHEQSQPDSPKITSYSLSLFDCDFTL